MGKLHVPKEPLSTLLPGSTLNSSRSTSMSAAWWESSSELGTVSDDSMDVLVALRFDVTTPVIDLEATEFSLKPKVEPGFTGTKEGFGMVRISGHLSSTRKEDLTLQSIRTCISNQLTYISNLPHVVSGWGVPCCSQASGGESPWSCVAF
jgi:hypothetical protein